MNNDEIKKKQEDLDTINVLDIFRRVAYYWPLFLIVTALAIALAFIYLKYATPVYVTKAKIYIKDQPNSTLSSSVEDLAFGNKNTVLENEMELVKSPIILEEVISQQNFNIFYYLKGKVARKELYKSSPFTIKVVTDSSKVGSYNINISLSDDNKQVAISVPDASRQDKKRLVAKNFDEVFGIGKDKFSISYNPLLNANRDKNFEIVIDSIIPLAYKKAEEITTTPLTRAGSVFELTYEDPIAERSADFLNSLLNVYNSYTLNDKNRITLNIIRFIEGRLKSLGVELNALERNVEGFKKTRGITELGENSRLYLEQVRDADARLDQAKIQLSVFDQVEKYINNPNNNVPFTPGSIDAPLAALINRYEELLAEKRRKLLSAEPTNPIIENINQQINETTKTIKNYIAGFRRNSTIEQGGLQKQLNEVEGQIRRVPTYEREFINIKRQQGVKEQLYLYLLQKKEESEVSYASTIVNNKVISPAYIPTSPIRPKKTIVFTIFIFIGFILTLIYLGLKFVLNNKINLKKDIESRTSIPVIAEIFSYDSSIENIKISFSERGVLTEQILNLKNSLRFLLTNATGTPVILFTSSIPGEGKTFLSSQLAQSLTYNNKKVVLLELDLRKPKLSKSLGVSNSVGITNYLIGSVPLEKAITQVREVERLYILPSGPIPPNPIELIESERMAELFLQLKQMYDYVVIDTSPLGMVSDAKSLAPYVDCTLFVIRFNHTLKSKFQEVVESLDKKIFKKTGIIFNAIDPASSYYNYGGNGQYSYGYGDNILKRKRSLSSVVKSVKRRVI